MPHQTGAASVGTMCPRNNRSPLTGLRGRFSSVVGPLRSALVRPARIGWRVLGCVVYHRVLRCSDDRHEATGLREHQVNSRRRFGIARRAINRRMRCNVRAFNQPQATNDCIRFDRIARSTDASQGRTISGVHFRYAIRCVGSYRGCTFSCAPYRCTLRCGNAPSFDAFRCVRWYQHRRCDWRSRCCTTPQRCTQRNTRICPYSPQNMPCF